MGRGDKKTKKGKIFSGSFGKTRPSKLVKKAKPAPVPVPVPVSAPVVVEVEKKASTKKAK